jgi:hypothetical protein
MTQRALQRARSTLARWAASPALVTLHLTRELVEFSETTLGHVVTTLSFSGAARQLKQRHKERARDGAGWFTGEESALVEVLAALIVPSDQTGPGADQMGLAGRSAAETVDELVKRSPRRQSLYARGLLALDRLAKTTGKSRFVELPRENQLQLLQFVDRLHQTWSTPRSHATKIKNKIDVLYRKWSGVFAAVELFPSLVQDVLQAFYTHPVSWIWLGYDGPPMPEGYPGLDARSPIPEAGIRS